MKVVLIVAGQISKNGNLYTEDCLKEASKLHKDLSLEDTEGGLALVWNVSEQDKENWPDGGIGIRAGLKNL